ncbi:3511_t:CDS:2 [Paraglomus brasilianum]|uniref:3511_t:CDS:1 n=1 Tax=Paraglomus brasilianum TaxID=144538 RepID=A0A9N9GHJ1_9GLOM|nr:3511_t:CDS:2 [Paraglomus brasilianum]
MSLSLDSNLPHDPIQLSTHKQSIDIGLCTQELTNQSVVSTPGTVIQDKRSSNDGTFEISMEALTIAISTKCHSKRHSYPISQTTYSQYSNKHRRKRSQEKALDDVKGRNVAERRSSMISSSSTSTIQPPIKQTNKTPMEIWQKSLTTSTTHTFSSDKSNSSQAEQSTILDLYSVHLITLFLLGLLTSFIVNHLLEQNHVTEYPENLVKLNDTVTLIPPIHGVLAVLVGWLFPFTDYWYLKHSHKPQREWSDVMRCIGGFIGVAYTAAKLPYNNCQVSIMFVLASIALWFVFDRTCHGLVLSAMFSSIGTVSVFYE